MPHTPEHILGQTEEQRKATFQAAGIPVTPAGNPITTDSLKPNPILPFTPSTPTVLPPIPEAKDVEQPKTPTPSFDEQLSRLESLSTDISGAPGEREGEIKALTQNEIKDLNEINQQIRLHEAKALRAEEEAAQKGATLGFARGEAAIVRREATFRALELSALAQAKQGNLALATELAGNALDAKYKQQLKDLDTQRNNIIGIYDTLTPKEKKRADAALLRINSQDAFVKQQREQEATILEIANATADELRKGGIPASNADLQRLQKAKSIEEAQQISNELLGKIPRQITSTGQILTLKDQLHIAGQLRDDARQDLDIKIFPEVRQAYETIATQAARKDAVGDLTLLRLYAKLTDPTSSVREEEFESMESAQGALARRGIRLTKGQITGERLTQSAREQFVSAAEQIYSSRERNYKLAVDRIRANATDAGIDPNRIVFEQPAIIPQISFEDEYKNLPNEIKTEKETFGVKDILKFMFKPFGF